MAEILLVSVFLAALSILFWTQKNHISPTPTSPKVKRKILEMLPKNVEGDILELGAGWGTMLLPLSRRYPKSQIIGYETSTVPFAICWIRQLFSPNVRVVKKDFFRVSFGGAGLIFCYLYPEAMQRLQVKFEELEPGTWIVTNTFTLPDWEPERVIQVNDLYKTRIYLYRKE